MAFSKNQNMTGWHWNQPAHWSDSDLHHENHLKSVVIAMGSRQSTPLPSVNLLLTLLHCFLPLPSLEGPLLAKIQQKCASRPCTCELPPPPTTARLHHLLYSPRKQSCDALVRPQPRFCARVQRVCGGEGGSSLSKAAVLKSQQFARLPLTHRHWKTTVPLLLWGGLWVLDKVGENGSFSFGFPKVQCAKKLSQVCGFKNMKHQTLKNPQGGKNIKTRAVMVEELSVKILCTKICKFNQANGLKVPKKSK